MTDRISLTNPDLEQRKKSWVSEPNAEQQQEFKNLMQNVRIAPGQCNSQDSQTELAQEKKRYAGGHQNCCSPTKPSMAIDRFQESYSVQINERDMSVQGEVTVNSP
jgi:hypothetical protein